MSILIVDDNPVSAKMLDVSLRRSGYQTVIAETGYAALDRLSEMLDIQLAILDIMMPDMDGLTVLREVRERPELVDLPVILCTSRTDSETVSRAASLGCKRIVSKPIRLADLLMKVREEIANERPVLKDRFEVMSRMGVDFRTYRDVADAFASVVAKGIQHLENGRQDQEDILMHVHGLREGAELLGAERLSATIQRISAMSSNGGSPDVRSMHATMLLRELQLLQVPLQELLSKS